MRSLLFAALVVVFTTHSVQAAPPAEFVLKDQRRVAAPADGFAGSVWIVFSATFTNTSDQALWIFAQRNSNPPSISPYISRFTRANPSTPWLSIETGWGCYSGYEYVRIDAKATLKFDLVVPEKYAGQDFRADLLVLAAEDATEALPGLSVTEHLTTRSSEQAGR